MFPVKGAIPESQQIGREQVVRDLAERLVSGDDILMIEPRRVGKSSTLGLGALSHVRAEYGGVVAQVDLRQAALHDASGLADALVRSAVASGAGRPVQREQAKRVARLTKRLTEGRRLQAAANLAGEGSRAETIQAVATLIGGGEAGVDRLHRVLKAFEAEAATAERPVVVFIDEVQDLAERWAKADEGTAVQRELERMMRASGRLVTYAFAGSEKASMEKLFAQGMPLHFEAERYPLPPIAEDAWREGVVERFVRDSRQIATLQIDRVVARTNGQPLRTMQVFRQALNIARRQSSAVISDAILDEAHVRAESHPSWRQAAP